MANVSKIKLPDNTTRDIIDSRISSVDSSLSASSNGVVTNSTITSEFAKVMYLGDASGSATYVDGDTVINVGTKADKVSNATNGNFASLDSSGNLVDSGHKHSDYQAALVSGINIKTINNQSLLGSGNITISGGGGSGDTSSCVHITGDESVGGDKTFTDNIAVVDASHILYSGASPSQGFTRGYATAVCTDGDYIGFSGISEVPSAYIITLDLSGSSSDVGLIAAIGDSTGNHFVYAASNHQHNYSNADLEPFIDSGGLGFLSIGGAPFIDGATYKIVYYTGSGTLTFKTSQVQPGSGATTATFTGTGLTEVPAFYAVMLESQVNNESYRRVAYYTNESGGSSATPMGVSFFSSQIHNTTSSFSVSYNNGLYINSGGTNAGGYFHNPGTYTLYYLMASDVAGGGGGGFQNLGDELDDIRDTIGDIATILASI